MGLYLGFARIAVFLLCSISFGIESHGKEPSDAVLRKLIEKTDKLYRADASTTKMKISVINQDWSREMSVESWSKGKDFSLLVIRSPKKDEGISTLKRGNEIWNYFPKINRVMKVPSSMMMGAWMGTDFTNDDLVKSDSFLDDYDAKLESSSDNEYIIVLKAKPKVATVWEKIVLVLNKKTELIVRQENFNERGEKVRTIEFSQVKKMGGKVIPTKMTLVSNKKNKSRTVIEYESAIFDLKLDDTIFSKRFLQKKYK